MKKLVLSLLFVAAGSVNAQQQASALTLVQCVMAINNFQQSINSNSPTLSPIVLLQLQNAISAIQKAVASDSILVQIVQQDILNAINSCPLSK